MATAKGGALMASTSRALQVPSFFSLGYDGMNPRNLLRSYFPSIALTAGAKNGDRLGHGVAEAYSKDRYGRSNPETPQRQSLQSRRSCCQACALVTDRNALCSVQPDLVCAHAPIIISYAFPYCIELNLAQAFRHIRYSTPVETGPRRSVRGCCDKV